MVEANNPDFWSFLSRDFNRLRMEARMKAVGTEKGGELERRIRDYLGKNWGKEYQVKITGNVVLLGQIAAGLVSNQIESMGFAFLVILGLITLFLRSWKLGLLAAVPNLIPIVGLYGLMGSLGIELSTPTAMISSVVLGLVVDASIHFLYRFRYEFERRKHYLQALHHTYRNMGQALVVATLILVFGFASSVFASFRPTVYFGLLTSFTILFSLVCTLVLLPVLLVLLKPLGPQAVFQHSPKEILTPTKASSIIGA
jgi:predicted RND superfamily exporter protein